MNLTSQITKRFIKRKIATAVLVSASVVAFATLGDDSGKKAKNNGGSVLMPYSAKNFSLRSNYNYKSNNLFSGSEKKNFILLNKVITYQKGNASYVVPLKKLPLMGKIKFAPTASKF
ncbi:MAG TPA: hypothetical protein VEY10_08015 [Flavisolibacter sp.]|jgi:hypothetical protein|nr:hypothetical protein [Flavisolibacter sp.]